MTEADLVSSFSFLTSDGWAEGSFLLLQVLQVSVASTGLTGANYGHCCRLSLEYGNIVCIIYFLLIY